MKTHKIYFYNFGANSYTAMTPSYPARENDGDTFENRCYSSDDNQLINVKVGEVREVSLPDDLPAKDYCRDWFNFESLWSNPLAKGLPVSWQYKINSKFTGEQINLCVHILTGNLRSTFRMSLKSQLIKWLEGESVYSSPFSPKQWESLTGGHGRRY